MPTGIYERTEKNCNFFIKGKIPYNKGKQSERKIKRIQMVREGQSIECKIHGIHYEWRIHSQNNVQCKKCSADWQRKRKIQNPLKMCLKDAKKHAKRNGRKFDISEKELEEIKIIQNNRCALSNIEFGEQTFPSIDRIDSSKGYERENIQLVTIEINRMKSNLVQSRFVELCSNVARKSGARIPKVKR